MNKFENYTEFLKIQYRHFKTNAHLKSLLPVAKFLHYYATATRDVLPRFEKIDNELSEKVRSQGFNNGALTALNAQIGRPEDLLQLDDMLQHLHKQSSAALRSAIDTFVQNAYSIDSLVQVLEVIDDAKRFTAFIHNSDAQLQKIATVLPKFRYIHTEISIKIAGIGSDKNNLIGIYGQLKELEKLLYLDSVLLELSNLKNENLRTSVDNYIQDVYDLNTLDLLPVTVEGAKNFTRLIKELDDLLKKIQSKGEDGLRLNIKKFISDTCQNCNVSNLPDKIEILKQVLDSIEVHINEIEEKIQALNNTLEHRSFPKASLRQWHFDEAQKVLDRAALAFFPNDAKKLSNDIDKLILLIKTDLRIRDEKIRKNIIIFFAVITVILIILLNLDIATAILKGIFKLITWVIAIIVIIWIFSFFSNGNK